MKEVMWPLGDEDGTFDFSGEAQGVLISRTPQGSQLQDILLREFAGQKIGFDELRERTWKLPFIERHYRSVLQALRKQEVVRVTPVTSKKTGLKGSDLIEFPKAAR
jgi:GMT-like wHTH domain